MMRREEDPDTSPQKRGLCCQHRRRAGGILAGVAAVLAVSVVLILGGEELNAIAGGSAQVNAKLQADYDMLSDSLKDLTDVLPQMESHMERMIDGLAGTFDAKFGELKTSMEDKFKKLTEEQSKMVEAAKQAEAAKLAEAAAKESSKAQQAESQPSQRRMVLSPTRPNFTVVTEGDEGELVKRIFEADTHWRMMRRFFLERQAAAQEAGGAAVGVGARLVVDAGCGHGEYSLFAAAHGHRVLCFEPDPALHPALEGSIQLNNDTGHLVWLQKRGLGASRGQLALRKENGTTAPLNPLDEVLFESPELMRVHVGGSEILVLQGGFKAIERFGVAAFMIDLAPALWASSGTSLEYGQQVLSWLQRTGQYQAYLLPRSAAGGSCPTELIAALKVAAPAGDEIKIRRMDDTGDEPALSRVLRVAEPFEPNLAALLKAMTEHSWTCTLWMEGVPEAGAAAGTAEGAAGAAAAGSGRAGLAEVGSALAATVQSALGTTDGSSAARQVQEADASKEPGMVAAGAQAAAATDGASTGASTAAEVQQVHAVPSQADGAGAAAAAAGAQATTTSPAAGTEAAAATAAAAAAGAGQAAAAVA